MSSPPTHPDRAMTTWAACGCAMATCVASQRYGALVREDPHRSDHVLRGAVARIDHHVVSTLGNFERELAVAIFGAAYAKEIVQVVLTKELSEIFEEGLVLVRKCRRVFFRCVSELVWHRSFAVDEPP